MPKEEKGYWFSTENGTHIHAEEGESKEQAMGKKFGNFKKGGETKKMSKREEAEKWAKEQGYSGLDDPDFERAWGPYEEDEDDDLPMKVESRSTINEKQSNDPSKLADKIGNEENSMDKYKNMSLKEKWDAWKKFENSGDEESIDEMNELAESIESELPFENEEEHQKWLDVYSSYKNVGEIDKLTAEIIGRKEEKPSKNLTTKEKWDKYNKIAFTGDVDDIDNANELLSQIENELPFKDEKEHQKWLDLVSEDMGEGKVEALTEEILARKKESKKQKLTSRDIPNVEDDLVSKDGNITLKEWFGKNSHQLQGEQENKDYVVEAMMDKFDLTKREAKNYYDEMFEK